MKSIIPAVLLMTCLPFGAGAALQQPPTHTVITIPGGAHGIHFDDIGFAPALHRVMVPAGATGNLVLIDPATGALTVIPGVGAPAAAGKPQHGATSSAVYAEGYLFANNHDPAEIVTIDPRRKTVVARTPLAGDSDYVRYVARTHEVWVTEPDDHQIQVFKLSTTPTPVLTPETTIRLPNGTEALEIDNRRNRAYTNTRQHTTLAISLTTRKVLAAWPNTCERGHGIAVDAAHDHLFVACREGKVVTLAPADHGKVLASAPAGAGIDIISYSATLHHLYVPGAKAATLTIFNVAPSGNLTPIATRKTAQGAHCVTDDNAGHVYVCNPRHGTILEFDDR